MLAGQVRAPSASATRTAGRVWHGALAALVLAALVLQAVLVIRNGGDVNTTAPPQPHTPLARVARMCTYFTIQSNLIVLVGAVTLALRPAPDGRLWRVVRLDGLLGIVVTALVFDLVLAPRVQTIGADRFADAGLHYVCPVLTVVGWLLFGPRPRIDPSTVGWALAWPLAWLVFTFGNQAVSHWCPYPFLDAGAIGYPLATLIATGLVLFGVALLGVFAWLDRRLPAAR